MEGTTDTARGAPLVDSGVPRSRIDFIDGLRATAVLLVFLRHATEVFAAYGHGGGWLYAAAVKLNFGELGVVIFFAISGFLIPSSFHGSGARGAGRYILSRAFRLYPAFLLSVVPSAAAHFWINGAAYSWHNVALNLTMLPRLFGIVPANGAYWTLEVEITFYLLCLLLFLGGILRQTFVFAALTLAAYLLFVSSQRVLFGGIFNPPLLGSTFVFILDLGVMFWAAVCRAWWQGERLNPITAVIFWGFAAIWIVLRPVQFLIAELHGQGASVDPNFITGYSLALVIFLAALLGATFRHWLLLWIGRISYSIYLFHGAVIHGEQWLLNNHIPLRAIPPDVDTAIALMVTLLIAGLSYRYVERPMIRLGRVLADRLFGTSAIQDRPLFGQLPGRLEALLARRQRDEPHLSRSPSLPWPKRLGGTGVAQNTGTSIVENRQLTGLRGVAAVNVMVSHLSGGVGVFFRVISDGNLAVDLFFVLSAFTLCMVYCIGPAPRLHWRDFALARFARIYPIYLVGVILGGYMLWHYSGHFTHYDGHPVADLVRQTLMVNAWPVIGNGISWNGPTWSVSVEALCYLICFPLAVRLTGSAARLSENARAILILVCGFISFSAFLRMFDAEVTYGWNDASKVSHAALYVLSIRGVAMFTAGWLAWVSYAARDRLAVAAAKFADALAVLFLLTVIGSWFGVIDKHVGVLLCPLIVLSLAEQGSVTARLLASRPVHYLGLISFSIYILHMPVMSALWFHVPWLIQHADEPLWEAWARVAIGGGLTLALASLTYFTIEAPGRRLLRHLFGMRRAAHGLASR